jgi:hypothetical protein
MKRIFVSLIVAVLAGLCLAATPTYTAVDANYIWECVDTSKAVVRVTGTAAANVVIFNAIPGWQYILKTQDSIGAAADSVFYTLKAYARNGSTFCDTTIFATLSGTGSPWVSQLVPVGYTIIASKMVITYARYAATNKTKITKWELWRRRAITVTTGANSWN